MKTLILSCIFGASVGLLAGCSNTTSTDNSQQGSSASTTPASAPAAGAAAPAAASADEVAIVKTTDGDMVFQLWPDVAPQTVANFKKLAKSGFYDGTAFHRIIKGFMIQGGDPITKDTAASPQSYGTGGPGYSIPDEFSSKPFTRGVIAMAHSGAPNSGGSQFFICLDLGPGQANALNGQYADFGKLIKGDDVLQKLGDSPCTGPNSMGEMSIPQPRVDIKSITIVPASSLQ